jgi:hypothetical protein
MKEAIKDILEKHYYGRNFIEDKCADEILALFNVSKSFKCCKETDKCNVQCDDCNMVYNF